MCLKAPRDSEPNANELRERGPFLKVPRERPLLLNRPRPANSLVVMVDSVLVSLFKAALLDDVSAQTIPVKPKTTPPAINIILISLAFISVS